MPSSKKLVGRKACRHEKKLSPQKPKRVEDIKVLLQFLNKNPIEKDPAFKDVDPLPNRFNILPGCKWDGVDRSTGHENRLFDLKNSKKALKEEAYKWSLADL